MRRSDLVDVRLILESTSDSKIVLMSNQTYFFLLPFYLNERETAVKSVDKSFFVFQWGARDVIVAQSWGFTARPDDIGEPNHLFTFVQHVDSLMPGLGLGKQHRVQMLFGGWYNETPKHLLRADLSLPQSARLISNTQEVPGLTAFIMDIARYRMVMAEALRQDPR
jgi:hypothetical protein